MRENHRAESLKAFSQNARRKRIRGSRAALGVYAYSFDNANESKTTRLAGDQKEAGILGLFKRC
jgi:hypothetical protein